jgi:small subunit ribosomal protein S13
MARIAGVDLPRDKRVEIGLTYIYGIGRKTADDIIDYQLEVLRGADVKYKYEFNRNKDNIDKHKSIFDLTEEDIAKLREYIEHHCRVEGDLRRDIAYDIKRLIDIGCYRGVRHRKGLPVRGQRSKTNARTRKGPRKTMANKKK